MLIALDWDDTYTKDPDFWDDFLALACATRVEVIIVTGRKESDPLPLDRYPNCVHLDVVYADGELKEKAALKAGHMVDIWIDDLPGTIQECKILNWD